MKQNNINMLIITAIIAVLLSSCGVTNKKYTRSEIYKMEKFRSENAKIDTVSMANLSYNDLFTDNYLKQYITEALQQNLDLLQATERLAIAGEYVKQAKAAFLPTANASGQYSNINPSIKTYNTKAIPKKFNYDDINLGTALSWEIDVWGKIKGQKKAQLAAYLQSNSAKQLAQSQLITGIATSYYSLLAADAQKNILLSSIKNWEDMLATSKDLKMAGILTEVAVQQYKAQLLATKAQLVDVNLNISKQENAMCVLLGRVPETLQRGAIENQEINAAINVGLPMQLLDNRPDIQMAEFGLIRAFELTNVAKASLLPSFSVSANVGLNSENFDNLFKADAFFSNLIGNLTMPIFNGRALRTQRNVAEHNKQVAWLQYKSVVLTAYQEVSDALNSYNASVDKIEITKEQLVALSKAVDYSEVLQQQGMSNYLEVLTAKNAALAVQLNAITLKANKLNAVVQLYRTLGGGTK